MDSLKSFQLLIVSLYLTAVCSPWGVSRGADGGFLETIIQSDGGVIVKVAFRNFNSIQTSAGGFNLLQVSSQFFPNDSFSCGDMMPTDIKRNRCSNILVKRRRTD